MSTTTTPPPDGPRRRAGRRQGAVRPRRLPRRRRRLRHLRRRRRCEPGVRRPAGAALRRSRTSSAASCWSLAGISSPSPRHAATCRRPRRARTSTSTTQGRLADRRASWSASSSSTSRCIDWLGWAITGALLFAGTAWVLGSRDLGPRPRHRRRALGRHLVRLLRRAAASRSRPASWTECSDGPAPRRLRRRPDAHQPAVRRRSACCSAPPSACCPASARR